MNQPTDSPFKQVASYFHNHDFVIANLESPLINDHASQVPGKCTLNGNPGWASVLKECGVGLVTLANNHMMDFGETGLLSTMDTLDDAGILYVGAGRSVEAARLPIVKDVAGRQIAFFGRSAVEVSSACCAGADQPGVAILDESELVLAIKNCRGMADSIIVMLHWGVEHYRYPTPQQRALAIKLVAAGADVLLGHHPHVVQGEERIEGALVSYSSGNFLFDDFSWSVLQPDGQERLYQSTLTDANRRGMMLEVAFSDDNGITSNQIFTRISSDARVKLNNSLSRKKEYGKLCDWLHGPFYSLRWKLYSLKREWDLRLSVQLSPCHIIKKIHRIRPRHLKELLVKIRRSSRVTSGKSTNPYEG